MGQGKSKPGVQSSCSGTISWILNQEQTSIIGIVDGNGDVVKLNRPVKLSSIPRLVCEKLALPPLQIQGAPVNIPEAPIAPPMVIPEAPGPPSEVTISTNLRKTQVPIAPASFAEEIQRASLARKKAGERSEGGVIHAGPGSSRDALLESLKQGTTLRPVMRCDPDKYYDSKSKSCRAKGDTQSEFKKALLTRRERVEPKRKPDVEESEWSQYYYF